MFVVAVVIPLWLGAAMLPALWAQEAGNDEYDGYDEVAKDANDNPIYAKDEKGKGLNEKQCKNKIGSILNAGRFASADEERLFAEYYDVKIGEFTWLKNLQILPELRTKFKQVLMRPAPAADVHDRLNALTLAKCRKIVADARYHRMARINCMLLIDELNQQEKRGGNDATIVPLPEARAYLLSAVADADMPEELKIVAMVGLERHAQTNASSDARKSLKDAMMKLLVSGGGLRSISGGGLRDAKQPSAKGKEIGRDWLRMQAANILGILAQKGDEAQQPDVAAALLATAADPDVPLSMRCEIAGNLGQLDGKSFAADKLLPAANQLAGLVMEVSMLTNKLPGMKPAMKDDAKSDGGEPAPPNAGEGDSKNGKKPKKDDAKAGASPKSRLRKNDPKNKKEEENEDATPAPPVVNIPPHVGKVASEELTSCLSRVRFALNGYLPRRFPPGKGDERSATAGGLLAAANDANVRTFIVDLTKKIDDLLAITTAKLDSSELFTKFQDARAELETWLKSAATPKPDSVAPLGNKPPRAVSTTKPRDGAGSTVGSE